MQQLEEDDPAIEDDSGYDSSCDDYIDDPSEHSVVVQGTYPLVSSSSEGSSENDRQRTWTSTARSSIVEIHSIDRKSDNRNSGTERSSGDGGNGNADTGETREWCMAWQTSVGVPQSVRDGNTDFIEVTTDWWSIPEPIGMYNSEATVLDNDSDRENHSPNTTPQLHQETPLTRLLPPEGLALDLTFCRNRFTWSDEVDNGNDNHNNNLS